MVTGFRFLIALAAVCSTNLLAQADQKPAKQPNVLFLIADDLNNSLGCYDHPLVKSPHIDRLAASSTTFERAYCQFPLCGPSRNSMLCGLYPNSTGILSNQQIFRQTIPSHLCMPHAYRDAGYLSARVGKMYHYNVPKSMGSDGHDDPASWEIAINPVGCDRLIEEPDIFSLTPGSFGGTLSWYASPREDALHTDAKVADEAIWILERCAKDRSRPFFMGVGFFRPHTPYVAPKKYFDLYPLEKMPIVTKAEYDVDRKDIPAPGLGSKRKVSEEMTDLQRREAIQAYFASITFMDAQVGRILNALEELGLAENTIVVFTSDHGYHLGLHGLWQKMSLFEESARVPLMIRAPGMQAGARVKSPVGLIDLYPTLTQLSEVKAPENLQGQTLVPMLKDASAEGRGWTLSQVRRRTKGKFYSGYTLKMPRYRITLWDEDGSKGIELYDQQNDPLELTNLADKKEHQQRVKEMTELIQAHVQTTYPASGKIPALNSATWPPNITDP